MFGYIKPQIGELKVKEHELYKSVYCGLCRTQRKYTGRLSALFLSYDFVFLYLLRAELTHTKTEFKIRKASFFHTNAQNVAAPNDELIYCACAAALLDHAKLKDDLADKGFSKKLRAFFLLPIARRAAKKAKKLMALPEKELTEILYRQSALERADCSSPDEASAASAEIFALFASFGITDELTAFAAERIGRSVGAYMYLADAAEDLEDDKKRGNYNPFAHTELRVRDLLAALDCHCEQAELTLRHLPVYDTGYRAVLMNVLTKGLHEEAIRIISNKEKNDKNG